MQGVAINILILHREVREAEIGRIMRESLKHFNHEACAQQYIELYEKMLNRPLVRRFS